MAVGAGDHVVLFLSLSYGPACVGFRQARSAYIEVVPGERSVCQGMRATNSFYRAS